MPYALGIDLGSGHLTAAICRNDHERWSAPEVLALDGVPVTEAVLHLTDEGTVEVGERALRNVATRPDRVTRGFVDRVGDEIPITLGGQPYPAEVLIAAVVGWVVDYAEAAEGAQASRLVVTHPAGWGRYRRATLLAAFREVSLPDVTLLPRPVAAAESYAETERVEVGQEIAVHSLGAGRFESAVLRRGSFGFELRAHAEGVDPTGGDLFDDLLATHVLADLGHEVEPVALAKLRVACRSAKERLSTEVAVTVPAPARSPRGTVMVNRTDLEELIRPAVEATVTTLQRTIQAAGTSTGSLRAVVLVGGSGRIPLVSELVSASVRAHVAAAADPELSVARGAALAAARVAKPTVRAPALTHTPEPLARSAVTDLLRFDDLAEEEVADIGPPPPRPPVEIAPLEPPKRRLLRLGGRSGGRADDEDFDPRRDPDLSLADDDFDLDQRPARRTRAADLDRKPRRYNDDDLNLRPGDDDQRPGRRARDADLDREPGHHDDLDPRSLRDVDLDQGPARRTRAADLDRKPRRYNDDDLNLRPGDDDQRPASRTRSANLDREPRRQHDDELDPRPAHDVDLDQGVARRNRAADPDPRPASDVGLDRGAARRTRSADRDREPHRRQDDGDPRPSHDEVDFDQRPARRTRSADPDREPHRYRDQHPRPAHDDVDQGAGFDLRPQDGADFDPRPARRGAGPDFAPGRALRRDDDYDPRPHPRNTGADLAPEPEPASRDPRPARHDLVQESQPAGHDDLGPRRGYRTADEPPSGRRDQGPTRRNPDAEFAPDAHDPRPARPDFVPEPGPSRHHRRDPDPPPRRRPNPGHDTGRSHRSGDDREPVGHRSDPALRPTRHGEDSGRTGRRHRTDDSAFNESLSRSSHASHADEYDYDAADEPRRGRDLR